MRLKDNRRAASRPAKTPNPWFFTLPIKNAMMLCSYAMQVLFGKGQIRKPGGVKGQYPRKPSHISHFAAALVRQRPPRIRHCELLSVMPQEKYISSKNYRRNIEIKLFLLLTFGVGLSAGIGGGGGTFILALVAGLSVRDLECLWFVVGLEACFSSIGKRVALSLSLLTETPESNGPGLGSGGVSAGLRSVLAFELFRVSWKVLLALVTAARREPLVMARPSPPLASAYCCSSRSISPRIVMPLVAMHSS